jgi:hypothetical protein
MVMLGVVVAVLAGFAIFIIHLIRGERLTTEQSPAAAARPIVLPGADPQEGTAQC